MLDLALCLSSISTKQDERGVERTTNTIVQSKNSQDSEHEMSEGVYILPPAMTDKSLFIAKDFHLTLES